jgi:DNA repair protein RecO (recombination protein O)
MAIEWQDEGVVLSARRHGEVDVILHLMTFQHGRHAGIVKGGLGRERQALLQTGNRLEATWRARLADQLGSWRLEPHTLYAARLLDEPLALAALASAAALLDQGLAERDPHPTLYAGLIKLIERLGPGTAWLGEYVRFEVLMLAELGFGLDLSRCAVTGAHTDLAYVSPRTGRAVSRSGAGPHAQKLLPLPRFLVDGGDGDPIQVTAGLKLTGHFLKTSLFEPRERPLPAARDRLVQLVGKAAVETMR